MKPEILIKTLKNGGIAVMPTDTIFGIVCNALDRSAVEKVYKIKKRNPKKPLIILIADIKDIKKFNVSLNEFQKKCIKKYWPGKTTIILNCEDKNFEYLHRRTQTLAFRLPKKESLIKILKKTGPLIAPSANPEGLLPAKTVKDAKKYFGENVQVYIGGPVSKKASKIIKVDENGEEEILRK